MKFDLKSAWAVQAARIDALSLRERAILFLVVIVCCVSLANVVWLSPAQEAHKQLTLRFDKQSADLQRAREELKSTAKPVDTSTAVREDIARVKEQLRVVNQTVEAVLPAATEVTPLTQVLVHFLRRHEGLTLVSTVALAPVADVSNIGPLPGASAAAVPIVLTRQGVALTVSGAYPELTRYVTTLEQALPYVRWGAMKLKSDKLPPELTLQLFLIGVQP